MFKWYKYLYISYHFLCGLQKVFLCLLMGMFLFVCDDAGCIAWNKKNYLRVCALVWCFNCIVWLRIQQNMAMQIFPWNYEMWFSFPGVMQYLSNRECCLTVKCWFEVNLYWKPHLRWDLIHLQVCKCPSPIFLLNFIIVSTFVVFLVKKCTHTN